MNEILKFLKKLINKIFKEIDKHSELTQALDIHNLVDKNVYDNLMNL